MSRLSTALRCFIRFSSFISSLFFYAKTNIPSLSHNYLKEQ